MTTALPEEQTRFYLRFTLNQRVQHLLLAVSTFALVITGMPLRYASSEASATVVQWLGGYELRGLAHRAAAVVLVLLSLYHVVYVLVNPNGRRELLELIPQWQDLKDFLGMMRYYLTRRREPPAFGRFNYIEKFEYWAVAWGMVVMGTTGVVLWFSNWALLLLPKWVLDISRVVHSYEGLLAFLSIIIWHFYNVHLGPHVFPMSLTWIDGLVEEKRLEEEHPLEYESVKGDAARWIIGPSRRQAALFALPTVEVRERVPVSFGAVLAAVIGGVMGGVAAPVFLTPLLALTVWLLNPEPNPWGAAVLCVSLVLMPSAVLGACLSAALSLVGNPPRSCVFVTLAGLMGLLLGMMSIWVPFAAGVYVVRWFLPIPAAAQALMMAAVVLSLAVGLLGVILGVVRGRLVGNRLFASTSQPSADDSGEQTAAPH
jgi:formate dehydrogenase gamma subunit